MFKPTVTKALSRGDNVGIVYGLAYTAQIKRCYAAGSVTGENSTGRLLGAAGESLPMEDCFANAVVFGRRYASGLVGEVRKNASLENCFAAGRITVLDSFGGGVAGTISGRLKNGYVSAETHTDNPI